MEQSIIKVFGTDKPSASTNISKGSEEKSTIDKVFEELDIESETNKAVKDLPKACVTSDENTEQGGFVHPTDEHDSVIENGNEHTEGRDLETVLKPLGAKNDGSSNVTNLMQHVDIGQRNESIKTKDGIELADLLENDFTDLKIGSNVDSLKQSDNLLDNDPSVTVATGADLKHDDSNTFALSDKITSESKNQFLPGIFEKDIIQQQSQTADVQTSQDAFSSLDKQVEAVFDISKASNHFPESSLEYSNTQMNCYENSAADSSHNALNYHINHLPSLESEENSFDGSPFSPYDARLMEPAQYHQNEDFASGDFNSDLPVDAADFLNKYKQMEAQQELLNHSLISLSSHFAQVQLRLKQIINSPKQEQEALLRNLEKFTFIGIPEVNELCLYNYENRVEESEKANKSYIEDKLAFEKNKHKEMIGKLRAQLEALENYVYEFSNNDSADIPTNQIVSKQQIIINELKDKLNLNLNFSEEGQLREEINKSIITPMKTKEDLILQLKTQISDLEKFINFLQSTQCKCTNEPGQVDMKNKTISIMKKISTILHIFAEHHSSSFKKPATVAAMKKSMKVNHYGDLRAQLEIAINHVMEACRQPPDQDLPIDSDYMSDTEDPVPCNSKVALAVRKQLAPTLQRLLQHGLSSINATQTVSVVQYISCASASRRHHASAHIWDLIAKYYEIKDGADFNCKPNRKLSESFNLEIGNGNLGIKQSLLASIGNILSIHHKYKKFNPDSYFKSFVCDGLNKKLLVEWLLLILNYKTLATEFYAPWSYVSSTQFSDAAQSLRRLYEFHFSLTIVDVTIRNLQSIKDAF